MGAKSDYRLTKSAYYLDFILTPLAAAGALGWLFTGRVAAEAFSSALIAGAMIWSLAEYGIHRFVFHHGDRLRRQHLIHHVRPEDYIGASSFVTCAIFAVLAFGLTEVLGRSIGVGAFVGLLAGYYAYIVIHDRFHHAREIRRGSLLHRLYENHAYHHRRARVNFGVTSPLWDIAFATYAKPVMIVENKRRG